MQPSHNRCLLAALLVAISASQAVGQDFELKVPAGLPAPSIPSKNKLTAQRVELADNTIEGFARTVVDQRAAS